MEQLVLNSNSIPIILNSMHIELLILKFLKSTNFLQILSFGNYSITIVIHNVEEMRN